MSIAKHLFGLLPAQRIVQLVAGASVAAVVGSSTPVLAESPLRSAYELGVATATQDNDLAGALDELDRRIEEHRQDRKAQVQDPALSSLHLLRAVLLYATDGERARDQILDALEAALNIHPWADFEPSMRSPQLTQLLTEARTRIDTKAPDSRALLRLGPRRCQQATEIYVAYDAQLGVERAVLHWRGPNAQKFVRQDMDLFFQAAFFALGADTHEDRGGDYFVELLGAGDEVLASLGSAQHPQRLALDCGKQSVKPSLGRAPRPVAPGPGRKDLPKVAVPDPRSSTLSRWGLRLSAGTGWGLAYGRGEFVYERADPTKARSYGVAAAACAAARRTGGVSGPLPPVEALHGGNAKAPTNGSVFGQIATSPFQAQELSKAYDPHACGKRQSIYSGLASAHFHLAPELSYRFNPRWQVAAFGRLQLATGENQLVPSSNADILDFEPEFESRRLPMPWAVGASARYHVDLSRAPRLAKLDLFAGLFVGYGKAALAIPMPFGQDSNGNSVADDLERACAVEPVTPVFPFMRGCTTTVHNQSDSAQAVAKLRERGASGDDVVDTLLLGEFFAGIELGAEYRFHRLIGLALSTQLGAWLGPRKTGLLDLNLGPAFHF